MLPTAHYNMGGIPTNMHGEVDLAARRRSRRRRAGPHGARRGGLRLRAWRQPPRLQLADRPRRVRPGRGAALRRARSKRTAPSPSCPRARARAAIERLDRFRYADGGTPTAALRLKHAEDHAARLRRVPHQEGAERGREGHPRRVGRCRRHPRHRPLADLEHRPDRDARIRQSDLAGRRHRRKARWPGRKAVARMRARTSPSATTSIG